MKSVRRTLALSVATALLSLLPLTAHAAGTTGGVFLNLGVSAKSEGMGGAYTAVANDATAVTYNPAGMMLVKGNQVSVMHNEYLLDMNQEYISYVSNLGDRAVGMSLIYLDTGSQTAYSTTNQFQGTFRPVNYALSVAYAADMNKTVSYGVAVKYVKEKIASFTGSTFALDAGVMYKPEKSRMRYGVALSNLGAGLKLDQSSDPLPLALRIGTAYDFENVPLTASADLYVIRRESPEYHFGLQYLLQSIVAVRLGYNSAYDAGSGITYGLGVKQENYAIDYAFVPSEDLGDAHRFSLTLDF